MSYILHSYRPYSGHFIRSNEPSMTLCPGTRRLRSFLIWVQWSTKETGTLQPSGLLRMFIFGHDMEIKLKSESNSQDQSCFRNKKRLKRKNMENNRKRNRGSCTDCALIERTNAQKNCITDQSAKTQGKSHLPLIFLQVESRSGCQDNSIPGSAHCITLCSFGSVHAVADLEMVKSKAF